MKTIKLLKKSLHILLLGIISLSLLALTELPSNSIYQFDNTWINQKQETMQLASLQGKKQIIAMIYTHCLHTCPVIVSSLQLLEKQLANEIEYAFVLVSLTPDTDTPEVLAEFAKKRKLNPSTWTLLKGTDVDVRTLAMLLNIKYKQGIDEEVAHSNVFTVLDEQGVLLFQEAGNLEGVKNALKKLQD